MSTTLAPYLAAATRAAPHLPASIFVDDGDLWHGQLQREVRALGEDDRVRLIASVHVLTGKRLTIGPAFAAPASVEG